jgi:hypothetical protein
MQDGLSDLTRAEALLQEALNGDDAPPTGMQNLRLPEGQRGVVS